MVQIRIWQLRGRAAAAVGGLAWAALAACADDPGSTSGSVPGGLVGGWSNAAERRLACFARDGRLWLGDSPTEIGGPGSCAVSNDGMSFRCSAREGDEAFEGVLDLAADELTISIEPCPSSSAEDCSATFQRDAGVSCE
jgi:hypothetical protein